MTRRGPDWRPCDGRGGREHVRLGLPSERRRDAQFSQAVLSAVAWPLRSCERWRGFHRRRWNLLLDLDLVFAFRLCLVTLFV